ncbi:MAG: tetratricopeptide repeat protein, partial [Bacteroidota bacterium]
LIIVFLAATFSLGAYAQQNESLYNVYYYIHKGRLNSKVKDFRKAIQDFDRALRIELDNIEALHLRGNASYAIGNYRDAILDYDRAITLLEKEMSGKGKGEPPYIEGDQGISIMNTALASGNKSDLATYYNNRGSAHFQIGYDKLARKDFDKALGLDPSLKIAQDNLNNMGGDSYAQSRQGNRSNRTNIYQQDYQASSQSRTSYTEPNSSSTYSSYARTSGSGSGASGYEASAPATRMSKEERERNRYAPRTYRPIPEKEEAGRAYAQNKQERLDRYDRGKTYPVLPRYTDSYSPDDRFSSNSNSYDSPSSGYDSQTPSYPSQPGSDFDPLSQPPSSFDALSQDSRTPDAIEFEPSTPNPTSPGYEDYDRIPTFEQRNDSLSLPEEESFDRSLPPTTTPEPTEPTTPAEPEKRTFSGEINKIFGNKKKRVIDFPPYDFPVSDKASISKVDITRSETKVQLEIHNTGKSDYYFIIPGPHSGSTFYLKGKDGQTYKLKKVTGLPSTTRQNKLQNGEQTSFTLHFEPMPIT